MSKGIFTKIDGELKQIKNLWTKVNGILVDSIIPKYIISGVVKDLINYIREYDITRGDIEAVRIDFLALDKEDDSKFVIQAPKSSSYLGLFVIDTLQGNILAQVNSAEILNPYPGGFSKRGDCVYLMGRIYRPAPYSSYYYDLYKINLITGNIEEWGWNQGGSFDGNHVAVNGDFIAYTYHMAGTRPDINNHSLVIRMSDGASKRNSFTRNGFFRQLEPYDDDKFILITGGGDQSYGYYTQQFWFGEESNTTSRQLYLGSKDLVKPPVMAIDGDIAYVVAERLIKKINLVDLTLIEDYQADIGRYSNLVLDRTNKLMHVVHSTSSSADPTISVLDYANNYELIYTYKLEPGFRPVQLASDKDGIFFRTTQILSRKLFNNLGGEV